MDANQINQVVTQIGLSAVFLFMLRVLWLRHTQMTDRFIDALQSEIKAVRGADVPDKQEAG